VLPAIVLAGGESRRMGSPKALLQAPDGRAFVSAIVDSLLSSSVVDEVVVVTGVHHDLIAGALSNAPRGARIVRNPDPSRGQLSSLWVGMDAVVRPDTEALLMTLVDVPSIQPATIRQVVAVWRTSRAPIVRPAIGSRHGHPVLFDRSTFDELRRASLQQGAKAVLRARAAELIDVAVTDEGCLVDVDTPDEYRRLR
jgi:molybdenum cofactor cytidylyltransferase